MSDAKQQRLQELLADRALWGLEENEDQELQLLLSELEMSEERTFESWDSSVGLVTDALLGERESEMPEGLMESLQADAQRYFNARQGELQGTGAFVAQAEAAAPRLANPARPWGSWLLAAAAVLVSAFLIYDRLQPNATPSSAEVRQTLIAKAGDLLRLAWNEGPSDLRGQPRGDVVWSDGSQEGFMRFSGLPSNDPGVTQYQLWIFDKQRDAAKPVDGGVFDVPAGGGESIVPIDPKILVKEAFAFAVTVEQPGGVVVSEREHIVVTAGL